MVQCRIDDEGSVDYSELREAVKCEFEQGPQRCVARQHDATDQPKRLVAADPTVGRARKDRAQRSSSRGSCVRSTPRCSSCSRATTTANSAKTICAAGCARSGFARLRIWTCCSPRPRHQSSPTTRSSARSRSQITRRAAASPKHRSSLTRSWQVTRRLRRAGRRRAQAESQTRASSARGPRASARIRAAFRAPRALRRGTRRNASRQAVASNDGPRFRASSTATHEIGPRNRRRPKSQSRALATRATPTGANRAALVNSKFKLLRHQIYAAGPQDGQRRHDCDPSSKTSCSRSVSRSRRTSCGCCRVTTPRAPPRFVTSCKRSNAISKPAARA